jgi:predicted 3-demethylubiquinone-9 3-methyltransferase (glyoxalase superfamily)/uncharacterized protein YndB with AHSA1/START domain
MTSQTQPAVRELILSRTLDAPRSLVFKAWTDPKHLAQWWGPHGFTIPVCELDLRPGGALLVQMHGFGQTHEMKGAYVEIVEPERLQFTTTLEDAAGVSFLEMVTTVTFVEHDGRTLLTMTAKVVKAGPGSEIPLSGMAEGWKQSLERLTAHVASMTKQKIAPFLWFDRNAEEAANFYVSLFPSSRIVGVSRYPEGSPGETGSVMTVTFELAGQKFIALNGGPEFAFTPAVSFVVDCATQPEVDALWDKLCAGGKAVQCGWVTDKFGLSWQIVPSVLDELLQDENEAKSAAVMQAMLQMIKLDIAELKKAYDGA